MEFPRYLIPFDTRHVAMEEVEVLVVGAGIAGMTTAIESARGGRRVLVITKDSRLVSNTAWAQGGIAASVTSDEELILSHAQDTIEAGDHLCDVDVVQHIVSHAPEVIRFLSECGARFDLRDDHSIHLAHEAAHSLPRVVHAGGDKTGAEVARALTEAALAEDNLRLYENCFAIDLLTDPATQAVVGVIAFYKDELRVIFAGCTVLASGGCGRLYRESSNPETATGDGHAMALRAGVLLRDLELIQFHPTLFYVAGAPRTLITEAIRGAGAMLRNAAGERFMQKYDERLELAPRDIVSRAIVREMRETQESAMFLDVSPIPYGKLKQRFPGFLAVCEAYDIDVQQSWIPVRPGPHYMLGGAQVDRHARTSLAGLYAVGEASSTGLHGANRLASNSLLEGAVMGLQLGRELAAQPNLTAQRRHLVSKRQAVPRVIDYVDLRNSFHTQMMMRMGVERSHKSMEGALSRMRDWKHLVDTSQLNDPEEMEVSNMLHLGSAMAMSGLLRQESRGVHYRSDFSHRDPALDGRHVLFSTDGLARWDQP